MATCPAQSDPSDAIPCDKKGCAWWDKRNACCAVVTIGEALCSLVFPTKNPAD